MRIISFITDRAVIDRILRHIGFKHPDTPPLRAIIPHPSHAGHLSGESRTPREPHPRSNTRSHARSGHLRILTRIRISFSVHGLRRSQA